MQITKENVKNDGLELEKLRETNRSMLMFQEMKAISQK